MSDKGFGDQINRSVVKNPLLSTAVVGLSIEDLTHNAVLLPAIPNQELISSQDKQCGSQTTPLTNTNQNVSNLPSGDANSNIIQTKSFSDIDLNTHIQKDSQNNETGSRSKVSVKSDDDFDVNEYFARLQGTRYVSAPLDRKEDQNANLPAEENLEEINLNEPDKSEEVQSFTADIAQNFSQLPTVLPQVASAVFSSFSNMLSLKSREQTPDVYRPDEVTPMSAGNMPEMNAPTPDVPKNVVPPPLKEPPISGSSNYRITTKKKVYAQIPGLTGDAHTHNVQQQSHPFFTPEPTNVPPKNEETSTHRQYFYQEAPSSFFIPEPMTNIQTTEVQFDKNVYCVNKTPSESLTLNHSVYNTTQSDIIIQTEIKQDNIAPKVTQIETFPTNTSAPIIPPPPMFSNIRNETQGSVGTTILPPSVRRRIAANQPIIKPVAATVVNQANIFVPTFNADFDNSLQSDNKPETNMAQTFESEAKPSDLKPSSFQITTNISSNATQDNNYELPKSTDMFSITAEQAKYTETPTIAPQSSVGNKSQHEVPLFMSQPLQTSINQSEACPPSIPSFTSHESLKTPPSFYDPNSMTQTNDEKNVFHSNNQSLNIISSQEPPKSVIEPPKVTGSTNYRMTKKKPQYYSGPIEGFGSISNNIKPVLNPIQVNSFQGALFTPASDNSGLMSQDSFQPHIPPTESSQIPPYEMGTTPLQHPTNYNTVFDLSKPTTETYQPSSYQNEPHEKQVENRGFGLLGSLKSKLSSLDINKIQNTVTTFFDPAYNEAKPELKQEFNSTQSYMYDYSKDNSTFDICVGSSNVEHTSNLSNYSSTYGYEYVNVTESQNNQPVSNISAWNVPTGNYQDFQTKNRDYDHSDKYSNIQTSNMFNSQSYFVPTFTSDSAAIQDNENISTSAAEVFTKNSNSSTLSTNNPLGLFNVSQTDSHETKVEDNLVKSMDNLVDNRILYQSSDNDEKLLQEKKDSTNEFLNNPTLENTFKLFDYPVPASNKNSTSENTFAVADNINTEVNEENSAVKKYIAEIKPPSTEHNFQRPDIVNNVLVNSGTDSLFKYFEPNTATKSDMFDFSNTILPTSEESDVALIENKSEDIPQHMPHEIKDVSGSVENVSELNICETCREVNKHEERTEVEDLTSQLIENITAPIQLSNPVASSVEEHKSNIPASQSILKDPLDDISQITEDLIENIPIHSVTELLGEMNVGDTMPSYGWNMENVQNLLNPLSEHNYNLPLDPSNIGFIQNKSIFENIPTNASDEIKAEFKNSHEEIGILPQPLLPTAPPDDDNKSDESGLDVHSIEQDAKRDFPIYDEFVIEPSGTDDDKIECMEREKSTEEQDVREFDTFTNRVERYKQLETADNDDVFGLQATTETCTIPSSTSPSLTMASYFDTGNYAVENHYRNSLSSPPSFQALTMRIPPGFEKEFSKRFPNVTSTGFKQDITYIPDTNTQTSLSPTLTFTQTPTTLSSVSTSENVTEINPNATVDSVLQAVIEKPVAETERLPAFSSLTEHNQEIDSQNEVAAAVVTTEESKTTEHLPDPLNFFSSTSEPAKKEDTDEYNSFSRLSSYFTTPPKSDTAKSFFELSQSQDHYRHAIQTNVTNFFETDNNSATHNKLDISQSRYNDNMNLIRDLAAFKDASPKDEVVRTVNYFTVEYDKAKSNDSIGEPSASIHLTDKDVDRIKSSKPNLNYERNMSVQDTIRHCKNCCNFKVGCVKKLELEYANLKIKKHMDSGESKKGEVSMDSGNENHRQSVTVNFMEHSMSEEDDGVTILTENRSSPEYSPVKYHWFYRIDKDGQSTWRGFSVADSRALENAFNSPDLDEHTLVATDGGRYDVNVVGRLRMPVYWSEKPNNVMRCSWFYCNTDGRYVPYTEAVAEKLEEEYQHGIRTDEWHRRLILPNDELVVMHGPAVMVHFLQNSVDSFSGSPLFNFGKTVYRNPPKIGVSSDQTEKIDHLLFLVHGAGESRHEREKRQSMSRPRVVKRGGVESEIEDTEPSSIDHLLLLCHGVGSACDMRMRPVEAVVDDFRKTSMQLLQSHYKNSYDSGLVGRIEVLPISWHSSLHSGETGVDKRLANVTLDSIPWLRNFTNDTVLDVLFYTSPVFGQTIIDTVCKELNRIYGLFKKRNPDFKGGISLGGHSLGSVILYDLLGHQVPESEEPRSTEKSYVQECAGTGQPLFKYPKLDFSPDALFALGSPIAIFECVRGVDMLGKDFCLPTCKKFFNIFHPYDPIAYRIEPMINPELREVKPYLIPHHKGRKRMHLELKDTMARVGADIKQKIIESIKSTWSSMWKTQPPSSDQLEKVVEEEMEKEELNEECKPDNTPTKEVTPEMLGKLNDGRRIDYVLQEAPFEMINEYLFAMTSHVCYWESSDTILLILREVYAALRVQPDLSLPQRSMTVQRTRLPTHDGTATTTLESPSTSRGSPS